MAYQNLKSSDIHKQISQKLLHFSDPFFQFAYFSECMKPNILSTIILPFKTKQTYFHETLNVHVLSFFTINATCFEILLHAAIKYIHF